MPKEFSPEYQELMSSWQWEFIRALTFNRDDRTCKRCQKKIERGTKKLHLQADHKRYPPKGAPLEEFLRQPLSDYDSLCNVCHREVTKERDQAKGRSTKFRRNKQS